jgi:hypothetical protein
MIRDNQDSELVSIFKLSTLYVYIYIYSEMDTYETRTKGDSDLSSFTLKSVRAEFGISSN